MKKIRKITRMQETIFRRQIENIRWNLSMFVMQNSVLGLVGFFLVHEEDYTIGLLMPWLLFITLKTTHSIMLSLLQNL